MDAPILLPPPRPILDIALDRPPRSAQLRPDLVEGTAIRLDLQQGIALAKVQRPHTEHPGGAAIRVRRDVGPPSPGIMAEHAVQLNGLVHPSLYDGPIHLADRPLPELVVQSFGGLRGPPEEHHPAHRSVEPMDKLKGRLPQLISQQAQEVRIAGRIRLHRQP